VTGARHCVTNDMPDVASCTVRGEHLAHCDMHARAWDTDLGRVVILDAECRGCVPRPAHVGRLCFDHVMKLDAALEHVVEIVAFMWADRTNGVRDTNGGGGGLPSQRWPLLESSTLASWVVASMLNAWRVVFEDTELDLHFVDGRASIAPDATFGPLVARVRSLQTLLDGDRDAIAADRRGAEGLVRFTRYVQQAYAKFPIDEREHSIVGVRCPACQQARLIWRPPLMFRGDVVVECDACGHTETQAYLEQYVAILPPEVRRRFA
jgi:Zn ribbon nucleic-acid-binding protein